jgi:hypothetical protein
MSGQALIWLHIVENASSPLFFNAKAASPLLALFDNAELFINLLNNAGQTQLLDL